VVDYRQARRQHSDFIEPADSAGQFGATAQISPNTGQSISGTTIAAFAIGTPYRLKYAAATATWYPN
jgi:hypothetical protein